MDFQKIIDRLKYYGTTYATGCNLGREIDGTDQVMQDATTAIETLLADRESAGWISAEDRLPDTHETKAGYERKMVIAATKNKTRVLIYERACVRDKTVYRWKWAWDRIYDGEEITHWMPLPKPPARD